MKRSVAAYYLVLAPDLHILTADKDNAPGWEREV